MAVLHEGDGLPPGGSLLPRDLGPFYGEINRTTSKPPRVLRELARTDTLTVKSGALDTDVSGAYAQNITICYMGVVR